MTLYLTNQLSKIQYEISGLTDLGTSRTYYNLDVTLPEGIVDGQYNYALADDEGVIVATGIAQVGDYVPNNVTHTASTGSYIVYQ